MLEKELPTLDNILTQGESQRAQGSAQPQPTAQNGHTTNGTHPTPDTRTFPVAFFAGVDKPRARFETFDWAGFCSLVTECDIRPEKDGPLFSPALWKKPHRKNENVSGFWGLAGDCDETHTLAEIRALIERKGVRAIIVSSHSHGTVKNPDAHAPGERYRVIFLLEEAVSAGDYPDVWERFNWLFGGELDAACKSLDRAYFLASHPTGEGFVAEVFEGRLLSVDDLPELPAEFDAPSYVPASGAGDGQGRPGDDFNARATNEDTAQILEAHGWRVARSTSPRWKAKRPGKNGPGISATIGHYGPGVLHVFTSNAAPFEATRAYKPFGVLALLDFGGDFKAAARELGKRGFGEQKQRAQHNGAPIPTAPPEADEWSEPLSLKNALLPVPSLPSVLIPTPLRAWVFDCAERIGVAPDYLAVAALVALASLLGNTVSIRPKRRDDWRVVPNLWGALVGSPSVKKSPAIAEALKPLSRLKALELERHSAAMKAWDADALLNDLDADALKNELKKRQKAGATRDELKALIEQSSGDENAKPTLKTYSVQDATIEALTNVLARNPRGFLIERDELTGWLRSLEKQGHEQDRAFFLESFNGARRNEQIERVGRGTIIMPHNTLSILGTIQPLPFAQLIRAASSGAGADGFVARFQLLIYPDAMPEYRHVDRWPNNDAKSRAFAVFEALDALTPEVAGAQPDDDGEAHFLRFDGAAQDVFDEWLIALENRLPQQSPLMEQHLAKYRSLMPSLALLLHLVAVADGSEAAGAASEGAAMMAVEWCEFLEAHARRIYAMAGDGATDGAELVASRFGQLPNPFTLRDVHQKRWMGLSDKEDVESALARLEDRGWIRAQFDGCEQGGRPTLRYWKHPTKCREK